MKTMNFSTELLTSHLTSQKVNLVSVSAPKYIIIIVENSKYKIGNRTDFVIKIERTSMDLNKISRIIISC